jgi:hypothetical protein
MHVCCARILVPWCGVRQKTSTGRPRALHSAEMQSTNTFLAIYGRDVLGSALGCDVDLYKGLIRSVLEYGCIAFDRMVATHMLKLERIQYRCLRLALGLMQSIQIQTLDVIGGVPPLRLRFSILNHTSSWPFRLVDIPFNGCLQCYRG